VSIQFMSASNTARIEEITASSDGFAPQDVPPASHAP
jgi:hypothetical protein